MMKLFTFLTILLMASAPASARAGKSTAPWKKYATPEQAGWSAPALREAEAFAQSIGSRGFLLVEGGAIVASWGDVETRYPAASIRKPLLGALYGIHVAAGNIDLSASLGELGIDDIEPALTESEKSATIRDLLTGRSGVYHLAAFESESSIRSRPERGSHAPGTFWYYNNWDFNVLATIFEKRSGTRLFEEFDRRIARPIGMEDFRADRHGYYLYERGKSLHPAYLFRMSALDMARFGQLYLDRGRWRGRQIVPEAWVAESTRAHAKASDDDGFGYLWWVLGGDLKSYGAYVAEGSGTQMIVVLPAINAVFVHVANNFERETVPRDKALDLLRRVLAARQSGPKPDARLLEFERKASPRRAVRVRAEVLRSYVGEYTLPGGMRLPVDMHQGELFVETRIGRFALVPVSDREFVVEDMGQRVRFASPGAGKPAELVVEPLWIRGAQALIRKGEHREAVNALGRLAGYLPNSAAVREALGDAYLASGDRAGAAASYRESLRLEPGRRGLQEKLGKTAEKGP